MLQRKYEKKLEAREKRQGLQEKERQKLDAETATLEAERREEILDKARTLQYYQTDRVKKLHVRALACFPTSCFPTCRL